MRQDVDLLKDLRGIAIGVGFSVVVERYGDAVIRFDGFRRYGLLGKTARLACSNRRALLRPERPEEPALSLPMVTYPEAIFVAFGYTPIGLWAGWA